jgi:undecaprenyl-diphosphatase
VARLSALGDHGLVWQLIGGGGALLRPARRGEYLRAMRVVAAAYLANQTIKVLVRRRRPEVDGLPPLTSTIADLSYPSAHAAMAFAAARALPIRGLLPAALALALSRLYLGVHFPSDAIAGAALGDAVAKLAR